MNKIKANNIANRYTMLIGQTFPIKMGYGITEARIDDIRALAINDKEWDVYLYSTMEGIEFREMYLITQLNKMRLIDYLKLRNVEIDLTEI